MSTDTIGLHDEYALVPPPTFVDRLTDQWTTAYHNVPSVPLRQLWTIMANTYQEAILDSQGLQKETVLRALRLFRQSR
jgi:hypothetical protein